MDPTLAARLTGVEEATARLLATAATLTDDEARAPSPLPGWTRGHVLAHVARNADGLVNLLRWARTGVETPMYPSREARDADIEAGARRPAAELAADVRDSAAAFAAAAAGLPDEAWSATVRNPRGEFPARVALDLRRSEVEVHHVDLAAGYGPVDWPDDFVADHLARVAATFQGRRDVPSCLLTPEDAGEPLWIGPAGPAGPGGAAVLVAGPPRDLLAWLLGRGAGEALATRGGAPPALPAWG